MILKVKELDTRSLILEIADGRYEISICGTNINVLGSRIHALAQEEILESYDSCDYTVKEMTDKLDEIYNALNS